MFRTASVILTIFGLLVAGPIHCLSGMHCRYGNCAGVEAAATGQPCSSWVYACLPADQKGDGLAPNPEQPDPECQWEACRGRLGASPRRWDFRCRRLLSYAFVPAAPIPLARDTLTRGFPGSCSAAAVAWPVTGRDLCITVCSFLL